MRRGYEYKTGLFFITGILVLLAGLFYLKGNTRSKKGGRLYVMMDKSYGLEKGGRVRINGVTAGEITDIRFANEYADSIVVELGLDQPFRLAGNSGVYVNGSTGFFAGNDLHIIPGDSSVYKAANHPAKWLKNKDTLRAEIRIKEQPDAKSRIRIVIDTPGNESNRQDSL